MRNLLDFQGFLIDGEAQLLPKSHGRGGLIERLNYGETRRKHVLAIKEQCSNSNIQDFFTGLANTGKCWAEQDCCVVEGEEVSEDVQLGSFG